LKELYTVVNRVEDTMPAILNFQRLAAE
jgi:hypothetical protein